MRNVSIRTLTPLARRKTREQTERLTGKRCQHPPNRLYAWYASDRAGPVLCVACCDCGTPLLGAT